MIYSDLYLKKKQNIPTVVALLVVVVVVFAISRFFLSVPVSSRASPTISNSIKIANLSPTYASIIFKSQKPQTAWVLYGTAPEKLDKIAFDLRDVDEKKAAYLYHYILLKDLSPKTKYYFKIVADDQLFAKNEGAPFDFTTHVQSGDSANTKPAYGKIVTKSGSALENAIVFLEVDGVKPLSTITKSGGDFVIPLNQMFDQKTDTFRILSNKDVIRIKVYDDKAGESDIRTNLENISPLPQAVTIGQSYNFTLNEDVLSATSKSSRSTGNSSSIEYGIIFPKENALIPDTQPLIKGVVAPSSQLKLSLQGSRGLIISQAITAASDGSWRLTLPNKLQPGSYSLSLSGKDNTNKALNQRRNFTIIKSGESVLAEATPEATPTLSSPTSFPSPTLVIGTPIPTSVPTLAPTVVPTSVGLSPTSAPPPPQPGNSTVQTAISSIALILGGIGLLMFAF